VFVAKAGRAARNPKPKRAIRFIEKEYSSRLRLQNRAPGALADVPFFGKRRASDVLRQRVSNFQTKPVLGGEQGRR
jgi:hypothetical protein